ncbi:MAG: imidazoleglycerol-phosphate dehydratase HisB [Deferrisomatales bacterium]|nr:imidazoleglycerol-phosphate dehydratase HisB [Deferrisomatales bacterium]
MSRTAEVQRRTRETDIHVRLGLDGDGTVQAETGVGFLDHMLTHVAVHGFFDLSVLASGDLHVDFHHTIEDVGIGLGQAVSEALGDRVGIARYGEATVPMDEALAHVVLDLSGRTHLSYDDGLAPGKVGEVDIELFREFFEAFARAAGATVHVRVESGRNAHHVIEAVFKAFGRALDRATRGEPRRQGVPSTKGSL